MASPSYPVSSIGTLFSPISNRASVLCLQLLSTPRFFTVRDQVPGSTSLPSFVSDVAVFSGPLLLKECGFDPSRPSAEGLTEQWLNAGRTQESSQGPAAAGVPRLWPGASPPQKKFARYCSNSVSGIMEDQNTHLAPASPLTTLFQHQRMWPFSGVCWDQVASTVSTKCISTSGTTFPMCPENLQDPTLLLGIRPSHQSTTRYQAELRSFRLCVPLFYSLNGI